MTLNKTFLIVGLALAIFGCKQVTENATDMSSNSETVELVVPKNLKWSEQMMLSEIERVPKASMLDFVKKPKWSYTNGLVLSACAKVYEATNKQKYYDYIYAYANEM